MSGKASTFVLDFANDPESVRFSFQKFYQEVGLEEETDPNKLGKNLSEVLNRQTITLILLMLMALPILSVQGYDFSGDYALRETFWLGRSGALDYYSDN